MIKKFAQFFFRLVLNLLSWKRVVSTNGTQFVSELALSSPLARAKIENFIKYYHAFTFKGLQYFLRKHVS